MRLVVDASLLVAEALRARGRSLLVRTDLDLVVAAEVWSETQHELNKRVALLVDRELLDLTLATQLLTDALDTIAARVSFVPPVVYAHRLEEARSRIPRDARDTPTVALALTLDCGIWTNDHDFFGCGVPIWVTETLIRYLETHQSDDTDL